MKDLHDREVTRTEQEDGSIRYEVDGISLVLAAGTPDSRALDILSSMGPTQEDQV
jgi:hypothetical protein